MNTELRICLTLSGIAVFCFSAYVIYASLIGMTLTESLVLTKVPMPLFFSIRMITLFQATFFAFFVLLLDWAPARLWLALPLPRIGTAVLGLMAGYETLWNFSAWFSVWVQQGGILDYLVNTTHASVISPASFNAASKVCFLTTACSIYAFWRSSMEIEKGCPTTTREYFAMMKSLYSNWQEKKNV